jgi:flagellar hook-associated protein 3 FlgL
LGKLTDLQGQLSTLKRIQKPSDAPLDSSLVMNWKSYASQVQRWQSNVTELENRYSFTESNLTNIKDMMLSVRDLVMQAGNDALGVDEKSAIAKQIVQQADEMLSDLNAKYAGRFVLADAQVTNPNDASWKPFKVVVDDGNGNLSFVDTITQAEQEVENRGSGKWMVVFEPKTFSDDAAHGGINDPEQKSVSVEIGNNSTMPQVLAVENYFKLSDSITVNGTNYRVVDMFTKLQNFVSVLNKGETLATSDANGYTPLDYVDQIIDGVTDAIATIGSRVQRLDSMNTFYNTVSTNVEELRSSYEDADLARTYTDYSKFNTAYQALLKVIASISPMSLVNYL